MSLSTSNIENSWSAYDQMAEFHEVLMEPVWDRLDPVVHTAFGHLGPDAAVVDVGAGSGMGLLRTARVFPGRLVAVEPGLVMRAMLTGRVAADPDLARRTTVHAAGVPEVLGALPSRVDGVLATHVLGHLSAADRSVLFSWLERALAPDGRALMTVAPLAPPTPAAPEETQVVEHRQIGDHEYRAIHQGAPPGRYGTSYQVRRGEVVVRELVVEGVWASVDQTLLSQELSRWGLSLTATVGGTVLVQHASQQMNMNISNMGEKADRGRTT